MTMFDKDGNRVRDIPKESEQKETEQEKPEQEPKKTENTTVLGD